MQISLLIKYKYIFFLLVLGYFPIKSQEFACDSLPKDVIDNFYSYTESQFKNIFSSKKTDPQKTYNIATYLRLKNDTSYLIWYKRFVELLYREISHSNYKYMTINYKYRKGISNYYLKNYHEACLCLANTSSNSCLDNYYKKSYAIINRDSVDWIDIIKTGKFENITMLDSNLILKFPNWVSKGKSKQLLGPNRYYFFAVKFQNYSIIRYDYNAGRYMANLCLFIKANPDGEVLVYNTDEEINSFELLKEKITKGEINIKRWNYLNY